MVYTDSSEEQQSQQPSRMCPLSAWLMQACCATLFSCMVLTLTPVWHSRCWEWQAAWQHPGRLGESVQYMRPTGSDQQAAMTCQSSGSLLQSTTVKGPLW